MFYNTNTELQVNKLPKNIKAIDGSWMMSFDKLWLSDQAAVIAQGYVPLTDNVPTYDATKEQVARTGIVVAGDGNSATIEYTKSDIDLSVLKQLKKDAVYSYYKDESQAHRQITFNNHMLVCKKAALEGVARKAAAFNMTNSSLLEPVKWYFDDGSSQDLTSADLKALQLALEQRDQLLRDKKKEHYDAIDVLTNSDNVLNYNEKIGWPL